VRTISEVSASTATSGRSRAEVLEPADGVELIGRFEDSGFREPPHLARRADGQVVQLSALLYAVAEACDGRRDVEGAAALVSERTGRTVTPDNVRYLADQKLRPLGVLALADGSTPELEKRPPIMALRHRRPLLSEGVVNAGARLFTWLHRPIVLLILGLTVAAFDVWLFGIHGVAGGVRRAIYEPTLLLAVLGAVIVATVFHEFGHASACRYGGARPGVMGVGLYLVWPAFYCDVTDAYRLNRRGRLRTDLGGVYFNALFALLCGAVYFATGEEAALLCAVLLHVMLLQQLIPLLRFDGYYVLTDLTGVPDILSRIKPIFRSLRPRRAPEPPVAELKPWVRVVVTSYLALLVPALAFLLTWMIMSLPRLMATMYDSFGLQVDRIMAGEGPAEIAVGVFRILALALPVGSSLLSLTRTGRMAGRGLVGWARGDARRAAIAVAGVVAIAGGVGYVLWPNGDYEPIRPGEKGTIGEAAQAIPEIPGGRPSFTPAEALRFAAVPTVREAEAERRAHDPAAPAERVSGRDTGPRGAGDPFSFGPDDPAAGEDGDGDVVSPVLPPEEGTGDPAAPGGTGETAPSGSGDGGGTGTSTTPSSTSTTPSTTSPAPSSGSTAPSEPTAPPTTTAPGPTTPDTSTPAPDNSTPAPDGSTGTDPSASAGDVTTASGASAATTPPTTTTTSP
jgi:putative peptide zinc metalloprotease protein